MNNPVKQHYIPRFILRPFYHGIDQLYYYDKKTSQICEKSISETFMVKNLYTDGHTTIEDPYHIEKSLSHLENEASAVIKRMREDDDIFLTFEEDSMLKLFLAIMSLRADRVEKEFSAMNKQNGKWYASPLKKNENYSDCWKRNLGEIVKCRSLREVEYSTTIDDLFKFFIRRDTEGIYGRFFAIVHRRGNEDFVIGDSYPIETTGILAWGDAIPMYSVFPISDERILIHFTRGIESAPSNLMSLPYKLFKYPIEMEDKIKIHVRHIDESYVKQINKRIYDASINGIAFKEKDRVSIDLWK